MALRITHFIILARRVDDEGAVSEAVVERTRTIDGFEASLAHTLALLGEVLSVQTLATTRGRSNVRDSGTLARSARAGAHRDSEIVLRARLALIGIPITHLVRVVAEWTGDWRCRSYRTVESFRAYVATFSLHVTGVRFLGGVDADIASVAILTSLGARVRVLSLTASSATKVQIVIVGAT